MKSTISHSWLVICWLLLVASKVSSQPTKAGPPELALQTGHDGNVLAAALSPDSKTIATVGDDFNVRLWKTDSGEVIRTLIGHTATVAAVAFSYDGEFLGTGGDDATTRLWDTRTGQPRFTFKDPGRNIITAISFSPNGKLLATAVGIGGEFPAKIRIWDIAKKVVKLTIDENSEGISQIRFSPDSNFIVSGGKDGKLKIWQATSGKLQRQWDAQPSEIAAIAISTDTKTIVTSGRADGAIKVWSFSGELQRTIQGDDNAINCVALANDDKTLMIGNSQIKLYDLNTGDLIRTLIKKTITSKQVLISPNGEFALNIGVSEEGDTATADVYLWKTASGEFARKLDGFKLGVVALTTAPDARLISVDSDKLITTWDLHKGKIASTLQVTEEIKTVIVSPDAKTLAVGGGNFFGPGSIWLFDLTTGQLKHKLAGHLLPVRSVVFSKNGSELLSGSGDGTIKFWDVATGQEKRTIRNGTLPVHVIAFSPDEKRVFAGSADGKINVWDLATETVIKTLQDQTSGVFSMAFSPDGKTFITAGPNTMGFSVWETATLTLRKSIKHTPLSPAAIRFVNNSSVVISNLNGQVQLWNLANGKLVRTLVVHDLAGSSLALIGKKYLASAAHDGAIDLFDLKNRKLLATLYRPRPAEISGVMSNNSAPEAANEAYMAITPRGFYSATEIGESATRLRIGNQVFPAKQIHSTHYRPKIVIAALKQL
jgi:WD40 repeat protein